MHVELPGFPKFRIPNLRS